MFKKGIGGEVKSFSRDSLRLVRRGGKDGIQKKSLLRLYISTFFVSLIL